MNPTDWVNRLCAGASLRSREARVRRFVRFLERIAPEGGATVVDVGGTLRYWKQWAPLLPPGAVARIDVVNLPGQVRDLAGRTDVVSGVPVRFIAADVTRENGVCAGLAPAYDVALSVSTIEHVGDDVAQRAFACALLRLGRFAWVQTPAKEFPLEAHFRLPLFAWWPLALRAFFNWRFRLGVMPRHRSWPEAVEFCRETRLLTRRGFARLFPGLVLWTERFFGLPKCYVVSGPGLADTGAGAAPASAAPRREAAQAGENTVPEPDARTDQQHRQQRPLADAGRPPDGGEP